MNIDSSLPGADLITKGLENLQQQKESVEALLVMIGRPRLERMGINVPTINLRESPEITLYRLLLKQNKDNAYSLYNSYKRRLISFESAIERHETGKYQ